MSAAQDGRSIVEAFFRAAGTGDIGTALSLIADDCIWTYHAPKEDVPFAGEFRGKAGVASFFQITASVLTIDAMEISEILAFGDVVVVRGRETCTVHATGAQYRAEWLHLVRTDGRTITAYDEHVDSATIAKALRGG